MKYIWGEINKETGQNGLLCCANCTRIMERGWTDATKNKLEKLFKLQARVKELKIKVKSDIFFEMKTCFDNIEPVWTILN